MRIQKFCIYILCAALLGTAGCGLRHSAVPVADAFAVQPEQPREASMSPSATSRPAPAKVTSPGASSPAAPELSSEATNLTEDSPSAESSTDGAAADVAGNSEEADQPVLTASAPEEEQAENGQQLLDKALALCEQSQQLWSEGEQEKAIECLDQAYDLILEVDTQDDEGLNQQKEDLRFMISRRVMEIYSSRFSALNGNHAEIPLVMNQYVEREIKLFQTVERQFFVDSYRRSGKYRDAIVENLRETGLPEGLSWLPLIESGFKVNALSRARALGLWQFIPSTGYKYGLKRDTWIDERMDPEKSTQAAIAYLSDLHQIFGDWMTVLAGYNCGEGTVLRRIREQKISYLDNFWDLFERLPYETARYVPRFLATLHIVGDPEKYGFSLDELDKPLAFETVTIEKPVQLKTVAETIGVSFEDLRDLNPELRYQATSDSPYDLKVPPEMGQALLARLDEIPKWSPPKRSYVYHRVRKGETLSQIARRYRTSVIAIKRANSMTRNLIRSGQRLKIPVRSSDRA